MKKYNGSINDGLCDSTVMININEVVGSAHFVGWERGRKHFGIGLAERLPLCQELRQTEEACNWGNFVSHRPAFRVPRHGATKTHPEHLGWNDPGHRAILGRGVRLHRERPENHKRACALRWRYIPQCGSTHQLYDAQVQYWLRWGAQTDPREAQVRAAQCWFLEATPPRGEETQGIA